MPPTQFSLLLRHFSTNPRPLFLFVYPLLLHRSSLSTASSSPPPDPAKTASLSARLSFVFDKIDQLEKERAEKDDALHRIRAWRHSKQPPPPPPEQPTSRDDSNLGLGYSSSFDNEAAGSGEVSVAEGRRQIEVSHPWPEWVELMERLVKQNYFDHKREDEDKLVPGLGKVEDQLGLEFDFTKDWKTVHNAMINFGKDRFDIFRSLSRQDIQTLVGYGCPSADKKVVFSSKLLRKHAHIDEGDVCSSCSLRNTCERAYLVTNMEDVARTIDVMRVLMTYSFDPINGSVENKSLLKQKSIKAVVRKLLHEIVRLSAVPIDPNLPPPVIKKRPPKVKQPPPPPKRRVGRDDIEMKKGDWLCPKCDFMNFAKNSICLQCDAKRPKRQLLPGEWECPQCDFLNYRRNMSCFNCEHKRPPDDYVDNEAQGRQNRSPARPERVPVREQVSNAWNFDFDDDESDGADVAAFEYADPRGMNENPRLDSSPEGHIGRRQHDYGVSNTSRFQERECTRPAQMKNSVGFDDFDDEEDDIDSYELDNHNRNERQEASKVRFSDVESEGYTESEGDDDLVGFRGRTSIYPKSSKQLNRKEALSDARDEDLDFDSEEDLPVHPKWKSSHVADSGLRDRASNRSSRQMSFDSDDDSEVVLSRDDRQEEHFAHTRASKNSHYPDKRCFKQGGGGDDVFISRQGRGKHQDRNESAFRLSDVSNKSRGQSVDRRVGSSMRGNGRSSRASNGRHDFGDDLGRPSHYSRGRRDGFGNDFGRSSHGYRDRGDDFVNGSSRHSRGLRGSQRGSSNFERGQQKMNGRQRGMGNFDGSGQHRGDD